MAGLDVFPSYSARQAEIDAAWEIVEASLASLPSPLDELGARFLRSISTNEVSHRAYFSNPQAPPLLYLPLWLTDGLVASGALSRPSPETIARLLAATMFGYFFVRIQDDTIDEPARSDPELLLLGNACMSTMVALAASLGEGVLESAWPGINRAFTAFSSLTLAEQRAVRGDGAYPAVRFDEHAGKVAYARMPLLLLCALAREPALEPWIASLIHTLGISYGLSNDAFGWPRDLRAGQRTYLLAQAGLTQADIARWQSPGSPGRQDEREQRFEVLAERMRAVLYEGGLLRSTIARAIAVHETLAASPEVRQLLPSFAAFTKERIAFLQDNDKRVLALSLRRALAR